MAAAPLKSHLAPRIICYNSCCQCKLKLCHAVARGTRGTGGRGEGAIRLAQISISR